MIETAMITTTITMIRVGVIIDGLSGGLSSSVLAVVIVGVIVGFIGGYSLKLISTTLSETIEMESL